MKCCSIISMRRSTWGVKGGEILSNSTSPLISRAIAVRSLCKRLPGTCRYFDWEDALPGGVRLGRLTTSEVSDAFMDLAFNPRAGAGEFNAILTLFELVY